MKSKVLSFAEYDQVDISMYKKVFKLDEKAYKKEIDFIKNKNSTWEEAGEVTDGALIVCDMESANPFFSRENLKIMVGQGFFSAGYARLLEEGGALVAELKTVVTGGNGLSLSDKERMEVIDQIYNRMLAYRNLTRYFTRKTISVSYIRSRDKGDASRVLALYGSPNERYW